MNVAYALEKNVLLYEAIKLMWLIVLLRTPVPFWLFYQLVLSITKREVLKHPNITVDFLVCFQLLAFALYILKHCYSVLQI